MDMESQFIIKKSNIPFDDITENGIIKGWGNVYNIEDLQKEISQVGSFIKTVTEKSKQIKILRDHNKSLFVGVPQELDAYDQYGLGLTVKMSMNTQLGKDTFEDVKFLKDNGFDVGFSIGGYVMKRSKSNKKIVTEYKLEEISVLVGYSPANQLSLVDTIKSINEQSELTQQMFWETITKAYDNTKFSDTILKSLELFLSLEAKPTDDVTLKEEPMPKIITSIYDLFI
jgi:HK97 family phage prohead protease